MEKKVSRQYRRQQELHAEGRCIICGDKANLKKNGKLSFRCLRHCIQHRERMRARTNAVRRLNSLTYRQAKDQQS